MAITNTSGTSFVELIGARQPDGMTFGNATTDKISLYGGTPVSQAAAITFTGTTSGTDACTAISSILAVLSTAQGGFGITA